MPLCTRVLPLDGILLTLPILWAATAESISGTVLDPSGSTIPGRTLTATNTATSVERATTTNDKGFFADPPWARFHWSNGARAGYHPGQHRFRGHNFVGWRRFPDGKRTQR